MLKYSIFSNHMFQQYLPYKVPAAMLYYSIQKGTQSIRFHFHGF